MLAYIGQLSLDHIHLNTLRTRLVGDVTTDHLQSHVWVSR